jgi:hypothetical protein
VRYRRRSGDGWLEGVTGNVSTSGVLFEVDPSLGASVSLDEPIEMSLQMPPAMDGVAAGRVRCKGRVARIVTGETGARAQLAVRIDRYRLECGADDV